MRKLRWKWLLGVCLTLILMTGCALAADTDFEWVRNESGGVTITDYSGDASELVIPEQIDGLPVTEIGERAFSFCDRLTSIKIPDGVTQIGESAFSFCDHLTSIKIPDGVTQIGESAFNSCDSLTSIELPDGLKTINECMFAFCGRLTSIEIPDSVNMIGRSAFSCCTSLTTVTIPKSVGLIEMYAFSDCDSLERVVIENPYVYLQPPVFHNSSPREIVFPDGAPLICTSSGFLTQISASKGATILEYIGRNHDPEIVIPEQINGAPVTAIGDNAFIIPVDDLKDYTLVSVIIPEGVTSIGDSAFFNRASLASVVLPDTLTEIGKCAFMMCFDLTNIDFPNSLISIGDEAFENCRSLTNATLPDSITTIGDKAFAYCSSLTSVNASPRVRALLEASGFVIPDPTPTPLPTATPEPEVTPDTAMTPVYDEAAGKLIIPDAPGFEGFANFEGGLFYFTDGQQRIDYEGPVQINGTFYIFDHGRLQTENMLVTFENEVLYFVNGVLATGYTGIVRDFNGTGLYIASGQHYKITDLVNSDGQVCYVIDGIFAEDYTGVVADFAGTPFNIVNGVAQ